MAVCLSLATAISVTSDLPRYRSLSARPAGKIILFYLPEIHEKSLKLNISTIYSSKFRVKTASAPAEHKYGSGILLGHIVKFDKKIPFTAPDRF